MKVSFRLCLYSFLFMLLVFALLFRSNADNIYGVIGDYYYKQNNQQKAQIFYEKSLKLNNKNHKIREKYVNTIINSPLTIQSQEKLVTIVQDDVDDTASSNAEYFLYNLKREIHNKYPNNYVIQAPFNRKIIHWGKIPITFGFKNQYAVPEETIKAVVDAFNEWERASSCRIKFSQVKINPDIWIEFISNNHKSTQYGQKFVMAYTTPIISQNHLESMVIKLNLYNNEGDMFTQNQLYNTSLHEIFHALGLMGHCDEKENIMNMTTSQNSDAKANDSKLSLTEADKATLDLLYKIKPDITNAENLDYKYVPYLIIGGKDDVNYIKLNAAKNYIRKAPYIPNGYIDLADTLVAAKKYKEAAENLEKAYRLAKNNDTRYIILHNLAVTYFYQDVCNLALDYANSAKDIKDEEDLHVLIAEIYIKLNKQDFAIKEYEYLMDQSPDNIDYAIGLANIYINQKKYLKARKILKQFIKKHPETRNNPKINNYKKLFL